ncbi:polysaccharide deacetylase family protein [Dactylosporangium sp. NPDC051541]|uniref:polysaccharide deacetylase family protein n=1 Tax=Dactylosporangium sp. NPDC051541 TaxID=3363977 RepID=UPI0037929859
MRLYRLLIGTVLAAVVSALLPSVTAFAVGANLIGNPSAETASGAGPASWTFDKWGTNTTTSAWQNTGKDGQKSLAVTMTARTSGDAKWMAAPVTVKPSTKYVVSDWYIGTVKTSLEVVYTNAAGKQTFVWLADAPISAAWKQLSIEFTTPADAVKASVYHVLAAKGTLQTDLYFLAESGASVPTPTPASVQITAPAEGATVSATQQVTATASADVLGVKFAVDGVDLAAEDTAAPFTASWDSKKATNGVHTVTATARTASSATAAQSKVTVTVNNTTTTPPPPTTPGNLIANPSVETANGTAPSGWTSSTWGTNTTVFSYPTTGHTGGRSVKTQISKYTNGDSKWSPAAVTVTAGKTYQYSNWYQSNVDSEIDVEVTMADGSEQYAYLAAAPASAAWAKVSAQYTVPAGATKITVFQVLAKVGWVTSDDFGLAEYTPAQLNRALVSLTFDDGWKSQYSAGLPLLDKYNMDATYYVLTSTTDYPDYMTKAEMLNLPAHGIEVASHTVDHPHLPTMTAAQIDAELKDSQATLRQWYGNNTVAKNFATPFGEYNANVLTSSKKYYRSHRSTDEGYNTKDSTDVYNIKVQNILNTTTPAQVGQWIDQAIRDKSWLVLVYHEVSATAEDPTYAVTPANLDKELQLIQSKAITVKTVDQALDEVVPQLA